MPRTLKSDPVLFVATVALVCLSIVMVWSASAVVAMEKYQQPYLFLQKQLMWATLGFAALMVGMNIDYRRLKEAVGGRLKVWRATDAKGAWALHFSVVNAAASDRSVKKVQQGYANCRTNLMWMC